uniref:Reverse transcriptase domain-containing protein n=1 Tax=Tanacetum cinerariifolium TaxID=118510 RepID=A0A6L2KNI7_TANCI|nr:hypothetical protein [Tanacetum cinerariifolium]
MMILMLLMHLKSQSYSIKTPCTCKSCGKGAHYGYNFPPKVLIISNPEPCHDQNVEEFPQTLSSFHPTCYSEDENSFAYDSTPDCVNDSPNVFNPPSQHSMYSYEFYGNDAQYNHDCPPQKIPLCYDDDDDEESSTPLRDIIIFELPPCIAITPVLSTKETKDSLIMGDEHFDTIPEKESDEFIKSSIENLIPNPSESEDNVSVMCLLILLDEYAGELILLKSIPPRIDEAECDPEEEIRLIEKLLYDNSSPHPPEEINSDAVIESFSLFPILVEDSDPFMKDIDLFLTSDGSIPPGIDSEYSDSEGDNLFPERLLHDDPIPLSNILDF